MIRAAFVSLCAVMLPAGVSAGQSSSLYVQDASSPVFKPPARSAYPDRRPRVMHQGLATASYLAVPLPEPRQFAVHDLVTIIIREATENNSAHELDTEKEFELKGEISDFPSLQLEDLLQFQMRSSSASEDPPKVRIKAENDFTGEAELKQRDTFVSRITARIVDVKPNGTLVLEARRFIQTDDEQMEVLLTGTCRKDDITIDNTVLSTQLYDMRLKKHHKGEMRKATKKGILTKFFEALFNF